MFLNNQQFTEEIKWEIHPQGSIRDWDGLTKSLINIVENVFAPCFLRLSYPCPIR